MTTPTFIALLLSVGMAGSCDGKEFEEPASDAPPPSVRDRPHCEFTHEAAGRNDEGLAVSPCQLAGHLSGEYRALTTWTESNEHLEIPFSIAVVVEDITVKKVVPPCDKSDSYRIAYVATGSVLDPAPQHGQFEFQPTIDNLFRTSFVVREDIIPDSAMPAEILSPTNSGARWVLDRAELNMQWSPSSEGTTARGSVRGWFYRDDGPNEPSGQSLAVLGYLAIYPEEAFNEDATRHDNGEECE